MVNKCRCKVCGGLVKSTRLGADNIERRCLGCGRVNGPMTEVICTRLKQISWCWFSANRIETLKVTIQAINIYEAYKQLDDWQKQKILLNQTWIEVDGKRI